MLWSLGENLGLQAVQFVVSVVLARLILPEQFGLIGILALFIALAQSLLDSGFGTALIQKEEASHLDSCSAFYFNLVVGALLAVLLVGIAPLIARFFRQPIFAPLTRFLSLNILLGAFSVVPSALLTRRMDFKALFKASLIAVVISGSVGIGLAAKGFGVWSLAAQSALSTLIRSILVWLASRWRPGPLFSLASLKAMFSFGSRMMLSGLLYTLTQNIYQPLIGKIHSAVDVGYYVRAQTMQAAATQPVWSALGRVMMPALSPIQGDRARLKHAVRKTMTTAVFLHLPLMSGLVVVAETLILLLLTDRWAPSIPYFRLFCILGLFYPLLIVNQNTLVVIGRSDLFFGLEVVKTILAFLALAITYRWGVAALLYGQIAASAVAYCWTAHLARRLIGYSFGEQLYDIYPFFVISLLMGGAVYLTGLVVHPMVLKLVVQAAVGASVYLAMCYVARKSVPIELLQIIRRAVRVQPAA